MNQNRGHPLRAEATILRAPLVRRLVRLLRGATCWLTGGAVRDILLGRAVADADIVVQGGAAEVEALAARVAGRMRATAHLVGSPGRAVWRIETSGTKLELWPLAGVPLEADITRRDFTCNALMWRLPAGPLIDLVGGVEDIARGRLRAVSRENLAADPVRLVRGPRFLAELPDFHLEPATEAWIRELAPRAEDAPRERVGAELQALVRGSLVCRGLAAIARFGLWERIAPPGTSASSPRLYGLIPVAQALADPKRHPAPGAVATSRTSARLGLLAVACGVTGPGPLAGYAWPRDERRAAATAARLLPATLAAAHRPPAERRELIHQAGVNFPTVFALAAAAATAAGCGPRPWQRWWSQWRSCGEQLISPQPYLTATEVMELTGVPPGPRLGELLRQIERATVRGEIRGPTGARRILGDLAAAPGRGPSDRR